MMGLQKVKKFDDMFTHFDRLRDRQALGIARQKYLHSMSRKVNVTATDSQIHNTT